MSRDNSISESERPARSRLSLSSPSYSAPSEAIPTFLPLPPGQGAEATRAGELQGRTWGCCHESCCHESCCHESACFIFLRRGYSCLLADTAKMFLLTQILILFCEWSSASWGEQEEGFYCSSDIKPSPAQHLECVLCSAQGSRRLPCKKSTLLLPPPLVSRLARLAACPALGDDYFLVVIRSPSTNHSTRFTQPDQSEDCIASLNITFLPSSVLPLMGHHQPHYYAVARTGKLNINNITIYDWALGQISCHHQIAKLHDKSLSMMHERSSTHHWFVC